jgi:hypothetical protein
MAGRGAASWHVSLPLGLVSFALAGAMPCMGYGQLELITNKGAQCVFAGEARTISVAFHNAGTQEYANKVCAGIYQTSSATAVLISKTPRKLLEVPAGETVLDSDALDFPSVKAETKFLIQWLENTNRVIGATEVRVFPTNLLEALRPLAENQSLGILDPQNELKPLLKGVGVDFVDLGHTELEHFPGKLAIVGPFESETQIPDGLVTRSKMLAKKGVAVVWIVPPDPVKKLQPSFYLVPEGSAVIVVAQTALVSDLPANPQSQLNLLQLCELALHPDFLTLPDFRSQPQT